jgi:hypothetical protein
VVGFLSVESSAALAGSSRKLRELLRKLRFGCRRCGKWLKIFSEDGDSEECSGIYSLDGDANFYDIGREMFCACGAIHNFCRGCYFPSTFVCHSGSACNPAPMSLSEAVALKKSPGFGVRLDSIFVIRRGSDAVVFRNKPGQPMPPRRVDTNSTDIGEPDIDADDYTQFYIGDLDREYAVAEEYIGDTLYSFDLNGPDGGYGTYWHCKRCDFEYCVTDK